MSFEYISKLPSVEEVIAELPLRKDLRIIKDARDAAVREVFEGRSDKFIVIIGPCSADYEDPVCEYVARLGRLQEKVADRLILIPRIYTNKPRTTGAGYKGMMHQPNPQKVPNITEGLMAIRRMHIRALDESHLSAADEMLYPGNYPYLEDLLSYVAIGARSVENQQHRLTISGLDVPAGMKNPTSGDLSVMLNSVQAAQMPHVFIYNNWEVKTSGNPLTHSIMRGAFSPHGESIPNYHYEDLIYLAELYAKRDLQNQSVIVDTNHANSNKLYQEQSRIALDILHSRVHSQVLRKLVKGLMIESYLEPGAQSVDAGVYGKSITDPCLGWEESERLVQDLAERV